MSGIGALERTNWLVLDLPVTIQQSLVTGQYSRCFTALYSLRTVYHDLMSPRPATTSDLLSLPLELVIEVLANLDLRSLLSCRKVRTL